MTIFTPFRPKALSIPFIFVLILVSNPGLFGQAVFPSPKFEETTILVTPGKQLEFTLSNLPDPAKYGEKDGTLEIQINWQLGKTCNAGATYSEKLKIKSTTHRFRTNYTLSDSDDQKQLKVNVSYVKPTGDEELPAQNFMAATKECIPLRISKR